ncbi:MAG: MCE family protein [Magnetococcales bacterium]|nr:MCE family protein [Magnetococcales bacterium]
MAETKPLTEPPIDPPPEVVVETPSGFSPIWLIPLIAAIMAIWIGFTTWMEKGPTIEISFETSDGIKIGQTRIKYRDVEVGQVKGVRFSDDLSHILVTARITRHMADHLKTNTRFWVVRPRLSASGLTGLGTLVSGAYIEMDPGSGEPAETFIGLEEPPVVRAHEQGREYLLLADRLAALQPGSAIYYRGITVGEVLNYELTDDKQNVRVRIFIQAPYHDLVKENTRFWNANGIDVSMDANGINVKTESLPVMLVGGISFETPTNLESSQTAQQGNLFILYENHAATTELAYTRKVHFVAYFDHSVRGLKIDAPVEFRGIKVGSVTDFKMAFDDSDGTFHIPVLLQLEPERIARNKPASPSEERELFQQLIQKGLRAQLHTNNYLTGSLFVELDLLPETPLRLRGGDSGFPELPTIPSPFEEITRSVTGLLEKLHQLPLENLVQELAETVHGANLLVNAPEMGKTVSNLSDSTASLNRLLKNLEGEVQPLAADLASTLLETRKTLQEVQESVDGLAGTVTPGSKLHFQLVETLKELSATSRSVRGLTDYLKRNPEALIFGKSGKGKR